MQTIGFLVNMFCAVSFGVFLLLGIVFYTLRRPLSNPRDLQKHFGKAMILVALHVLCIYLNNSVEEEGLRAIFNLCVIAIDCIVVTTIIICVFRHIAGNDAVEESPLVENAPSPVAAVADATTDALPTAETDVEAVQEVSATDDEEAETEDEDADDEAENVQPLENTNLEDLIFFQKVESLMATKRLFCEPEISRDSIAASVGTNRTYLVRSIKNATGKTFLEYITDLRTSYAATLLTTTDEPLDMIGTLVGFRSKSSYYRAFAAAYGCSPSEYKKRA